VYVWVGVRVCTCMYVCVGGCVGASPNRRDYGRRLCAEEWARFCGRHSCADAIAKYIRSTKYFLTKTFLLAKDKWKSEPDLLQLASPAGSSSPAGQHKTARRDSGGWLQRHLSLKRKKQQQQQVSKHAHLYVQTKRCLSALYSESISMAFLLRICMTRDNESIWDFSPSIRLSVTMWYRV